MRAHLTCLKWMKSEWKGYDYEKHRFYLKPGAPPEIVASFEEWKKLNHINYQNETN